MDNSGAREAEITSVEREILRACYDAYPDELDSAGASDLFARVVEITGDALDYTLGGQTSFYEALERLARRGCIRVNRGSGGAFRARITEEGMTELGSGGG